MLTPKRYWRVALSLDALQKPPAKAFVLPACLTTQQSPPAIGDGILLADYDVEARTGLIRHLGIMTNCAQTGVEVDWRHVCAEIWVDSAAGIANWKNKAGFCFAAAKVAGYGLHQLFAGTFEGLEAREAPAGATKSADIPKRSRGGKGLTAERLLPMEIAGEATASARGGYVYVLRSAYGFKVGRTRNLPARMRAFGIKLPIAYTIPLCAWFDDCVEAESRYHRLFASSTSTANGSTSMTVISS